MLENSVELRRGGGNTGRKNHKWTGGKKTPVAMKKRKTVEGLQTTEDWAEEEEGSKRIPLKKKLKIESR